jgi:iron complex outermembrane recepter protein
MNPRTRFRKFAPSALALAVSASIAPAVSAASEPALEEVLVNARKTQESLQDVSVAVTAFTGSEIDALIMRDVRELEGMVPNFVIDTVSVAPGGASIYIRGVGTQEVERSFDPAVGVVIDGVPLSFVNGSMRNTFDFESIEVLRGPQGTLFGRNTTGGVININRTRPTGEFGVRYEGTVGVDDLRDGKAIVNFPLGDNVAGKVGFARQTGGYDRKNITIDEDVGEADNTELSATLLFTPTENFEARFTYVNYKDENDGIPLHGLDVPPPNLEEFTQDFYGQDVDFEWDSYTLKMDYSLDKGTITTILGYQETDEIVPTDFDGTSLNIFHAIRDQQSEQTSVETRFSSNDAFSENFNFVAGIFYSTDEYQLNQETSIIAFLGPDAAQAANTTADHERDVWAAFAEFHIDLTDQLMLTLGGRYTEEEKDYLGTARVGVGYVPGSDPSALFIYGEPVFVDAGGAGDDEDWDEFTPKVGLDYRINDDVLTYLTYSEGFRSGGFNGRNTEPDNIGPYDPEFVSNWELGMKADFLDRTLRLNLAAFYNEYDDKQEEIIEFSELTGSNTVVRNASSVEIQGFEGELTWLACESLLINANFGYLDAEYKSYTADLSDDDIDNVIDNSYLELRRVPEWTGGVNATYTVSVGPGDLSFYGSYRYTDEYQTDTLNDPRGLLDEQEIVDVTIAYEWERAPGKTVRISAFGRDITDEIGLNSTVIIPGTIAFGAIAGGEQYGVRISGNF